MSGFNVKSIGIALVEDVRHAGPVCAVTSTFIPPADATASGTAKKHSSRGWNLQRASHALPLSGNVFSRTCAIHQLRNFGQPKLFGEGRRLLQAERVNIRQDQVTTLWTSGPKLTERVRPDYRAASATQSRTRQRDVQQNANPHAHVGLHEAGLVDAYLQPAKECLLPALRSRRHSNSSMIRIILPLELTGARLSKAAVRHSAEWYSSNVTVKGGGREAIVMNMWTPHFAIPYNTFWLYQHDATFLQVEIRATKQPSCRNPERLSMMHETTRLLLRSADLKFPRSNDFAILFTPSECMDLQQWLLTGRHQRQWTVPQEQDFSDRDDRCKADRSVKALTADHVRFARLIPSILKHLERRLAIVESRALRSERRAVKYCSIVSEIWKMRHHSGCMQHHHNIQSKLKALWNSMGTMGDAILRLMTSLHLVMQHPTKSEAGLDHERQRIMNRVNLATHAAKSSLIRYIVPEPPDEKQWMLPHASQTTLQPAKRAYFFSPKELRDAARAVIGAAYIHGNLSEASSVITLLFEDKYWAPLQTVFTTNRSHSDLEPFSRTPCLGRLEELIKYKFSFPSLLAQAVNHRSDLSGARPSYERLEYLGDSVLSAILFDKLFQKPQCVESPAIAHTIHKAIVNAHFLAHCCLRYRVMLPDLTDAEGQESQQKLLARSPHKTAGIYEFVQEHKTLRPQTTAAFERYECIREQIVNAFRQGDLEPWARFDTLKLPKRFSDVIEAILGAIFLDSKGDLSACEAFLDTLGVFDDMQRMLEQSVAHRDVEE